MSQTYNLGKVSLTPRGTYNASTTYNALDVVTYNGSGYIVLQTVTGVTPPNATYYQIIASKGDSGSDGSAATVNVGTISMLPVGSTPTVTNTGTTNSAIINFGIPYSPLANNSVSTEKIIDGAVTRGKILNGAVGNDEIEDGSVSYSKLGTDVESLFSNIENIVAETFDPTKSYNAGDYVIYGYNDISISLYRFTDNKSAGSWDVTKAVEVAVCNVMVDKYSVLNAGISGASYETVIDTTSATTALHDKTYPWVLIAPSASGISSRYTYRITFDNVVYTLNAEQWRSSYTIGKGVGFIGNASLWGEINGFIQDVHDDVPFLITNGMDTNGEYVAGEYLFTPSAGTHTVKVERIDYSFSSLPAVLINGTPHDGLVIVQPPTTSYSTYSLGENAVINPRGVIAFGYHNTVSGNGARVFGNNNTVSGESATAIGNENVASGQYSTAIGWGNTASGKASFAAGGSGNVASGQNSFAFGFGTNTASGLASFAGGNNAVASGLVSSALGANLIANHTCQFVFGMCNVADDSQEASTSRGNYVEIVGNGVNKNNRSNARTLDWNGNESLAGGITLGKGTADEVTLSASQLKQLLALLS